MEETELLNIWKSYDQKLDKVLSLNEMIVRNMTKNKLNNVMDSMQRPKQNMLVIGIPYTILLYFITFVAFKTDGVFVTLGFGVITLIMTCMIIGYFYHLHLINQINRSQEMVDVQSKIANLKISTFNITRLAVVQLPFWSVCWMSLDALKNLPIVYGGANLIVFLGLTYLAYWIYSKLDFQNNDSKISQFFLSGNEWEPILKASKILEQLEEYEN